MKPRHRKILQTMLALPTSPFLEHHVIEFLRQWAETRRVSFSQDRAGNVLLGYRRGRARSKWVFSAHMDHPGFVTTRQRGRSVWAHFRGWVTRPYVLGSRVRFFAAGGEVAGTIATRRTIRPKRWWSCRVDLDSPADVPPGTIGMWDLPAFRVRGTRVSTRACDDLAGTASVVCAIDELVATGAEANVIGLLTRAEEAGCIGAQVACRLGTIPPDALVVGIEASKAQPGAPIGGGVVVRIGDRLRVFDPPLTHLVSTVAAELARRRPTFRAVRRLMPGGGCESTVYCLAGYQAAALALPLGNYHNMGANHRVAPEQIDLNDFASLVQLLVALARDPRRPADAEQHLRSRIAAMLKERGRYLVWPPPADGAEPARAASPRSRSTSKGRSS